MLRPFLDGLFLSEYYFPFQAPILKGVTLGNTYVIIIMNVINIIIHSVNMSGKKILLSLPADLHRDLKILAALEQQSMQALIRMSVSSLLAHASAKASPPSGGVFYEDSKCNERN